MTQSKLKKMKKVDFIEGTIITSISLILVKILGMVYVIPFYKIIKEEGGALYSYAYNIYNMFLNLSTAGIPVAVSKIISEYNSEKDYKSKEKAYKISVKIIFIFSLIMFLILFLFPDKISILIFGKVIKNYNLNDIVKVIRVISFCLLIIPFLSVSKGYLEGHKIMKEVSISQVIEQLVRISIILIGSYISVIVLKKSVVTAVCISLSGAFFGGLVSTIYLKIKIRKNKKIFEINNSENKESENEKIILKKIISYSVPLIILSVSVDFYNMVNVALITRGSIYTNYTIYESQIISSIITTWCPKICMLITAIANSININLIPSISTLKENDDINSQINKALSILFLISLPMMLGIILLSKEIYLFFYGNNEIGFIMLKFVSVISFLTSITLVFNAIFQGINKYRMLYVNILLVFLINVILIFPLMKLFYLLNLVSAVGATIATIIAYLSIIVIDYFYLKNKVDLNLSSLSLVIKKIFPALLIMSIYVFICKSILNFSNIVLIIFSVLGSIIIYFYILSKNKCLFDVFGTNNIRLIYKKKLK